MTRAASGENRNRNQAADGKNAADGGAQAKRNLHIFVWQSTVFRDDIRNPGEDQKSSERYADRAEPQPHDQPALRQAASQSCRQRTRQPQPSVGPAHDHRDAAGHAVHADDGEIELADHHGQAEPERHEADRSERFEARCGGGEGQKILRVDERKTDNAGRQDEQRTHVGIVSKAFHWLNPGCPTSATQSPPARRGPQSGIAIPCAGLAAPARPGSRR